MPDKSVRIFHANASPSLFFNRGFAAFGVCRTMKFEAKQPGNGSEKSRDVVVEGASKAQVE